MATAGGHGSSQFGLHDNVCWPAAGEVVTLTVADVERAANRAEALGLDVAQFVGDLLGMETAEPVPDLIVMAHFALTRSASGWYCRPINGSGSSSMQHPLPSA
jgi:hypothetical protein